MSVSRWKIGWNLHFRDMLLRLVWRVDLTLDSMLHCRPSELDVDLRKVQKAVIIGQIRNEKLTRKIRVGIERLEWIREISSWGYCLSVQRKEETQLSLGFFT